MKFLTAILGFAGAALAAPAILPNTVPVVIPKGDVIPNNYIVVFKKEVDPAFAKGFSAAVNGRSFKIGNLQGFSGEFSPAEMERMIHATEFVDYIEQDQIVYALAQQNNPPSWGIDRVDQENLPLDDVFHYYDHAGAGVTAYIADTGIRTTHNDFGGRAVFGFKANDNWGETDGNGHGTHVASTTAGTQYGLAKSADLVAVKVLSDLGSGSTSGVVAGIDYIADVGTANKDVANMSLGGGASTALDNAVNAAVGAGIFFAVAAGNDNANACNYSPARAEDAFTVMASASNDARSSFSNYGTCCDLFAPGTSITGAWIGSDSDTNTISGTSMASPHVCGAAALAQGETARTPAALKSYLLDVATPNVISNPGSGSNNLLLYSPLDMGFSKEMFNFVENCLMKDFMKRPKYPELLAHPFMESARNEKHFSMSAFVQQYLPPQSADPVAEAATQLSRVDIQR